jgi:hypothetical protein
VEEFVVTFPIDWIQLLTASGVYKIIFLSNCISIYHFYIDFLFFLNLHQRKGCELGHRFNFTCSCYDCDPHYHLCRRFL